MCRIAVAMLAPALGQHVLFLRLQHREPADFLEIARQAGFGGYQRQGRGTGHGSALSLFAPIAAGCLGHPSPGAGDRDTSFPTAKLDRSCRNHTPNWGAAEVTGSSHRLDGVVI